MARGYGVAPEMMTQVLGQGAYRGIDPRQFALLIGEAVEKGNQTGQPEEVMRALLSWTATASRLLVTHTDAWQFASMYSALNASGLPGFKGQDASQLISQINSAVINGGGAGQAGQIEMYRALAHYGVTDAYATKMQLQKGMFELIPGTGVTNYDAIMRQLRSDYAGAPPNAFYNAMANLLNITMPQAQQLAQIRPTDINFAERHLARNHISVANESGLQGIVSTLTEGHASLLDTRRQLLARGDLSGSEKAALQNAKSDDALKLLMVQAFAQHGMTGDRYTTLAQSETNLTDAITNLGTVEANLVGPINDLRASIDNLAASLGKSITGAPPSSTPPGVHSLAPLTPGAMGRLPPLLPKSIKDMVDAQAKAQGVPVAVAEAIARIEDGWNGRISPAGAIGPMQLMPRTAIDMHVDPNNPQQNVYGGVKLLSELYQRLNNWDVVAAAYNAGPNNPGLIHFAETGDTSQLPAETRSYVQKFEALTVHVVMPDGSTQTQHLPLTAVPGPQVMNPPPSMSANR
jgi:hypothetical protein